MFIFTVAIGAYGCVSKQNVVPVLMVIFGGGFLSKGATDFGKNKGGK